MSAIESGNWNNLPWRVIRPGLKQAAIGMGADGVTLTIGQVIAGHEVKPHSHPEEQVALVIEGECDYYVDGVPYHLTPGGWVTVPSNVEHYIHVHDTDIPCFAMDIFCSPRPEVDALYKEFLKTKGIEVPY